MSGLKPITVNTPTAEEAHIYAEDDAAVYLSMFGGDGVSTNGQSCKATVLSNNKVRIADGVICVGGHFARIPYGDYIDCEIENGQSGKKRNDIIVARFETTGTGGIDTYTCEVKKGEAGATATDPEIVQEDLYKAGKVRELPLYRVKIEGLSITAVEQLFTLRKTNEELEKELASLNSKTTYALTLIWTNPTYSITRIGNVIYIDYYCLINGGVGGMAFGIAKLPSEISPNHTIKTQAWTAGANGQRHGASVEIKTDGQINFAAGDAFIEAGFAVSYPL